MTDTQAHGDLAPRVSVVVPNFNEKPHILAQSLDSMVTQSFGDFECIVVDESTDPESAAACRALCERDARFRYIRPGTRLGLAGSLNHGIELARAELIARFDSDDIATPDRLEKQVALLDSQPEIGVVGGWIELVSEEGKVTATRQFPADHAGIERMMQITTPISHPSVTFRKALIARFGGYDAGFRYAEDLDLWLRFMKHGVRFATVPQIVTRYRQTSTRRSGDHWRYNLRARLRNFTPTLLPRRLLGIATVAAWAYVPPRMQEFLFEGIVLKRR